MLKGAPTLERQLLRAKLQSVGGEIEDVWRFPAGSDVRMYFQPWVLLYCAASICSQIEYVSNLEPSPNAVFWPADEFPTAVMFDRSK